MVENIGRRCGGFLKQLSLRGCQSVYDAALVTFAEMCNNIEELNLNLCKNITDKYDLFICNFCDAQTLLVRTKSGSMFLERVLHQ